MVRKLIGLGGVFASVAFVAFSSGCGSDSSGNEPPPDPYATLEQFCQYVATAECSTGIVNNCNIDSSETCKSAVAQLCTNGNTDPTIDFSISLYNDSNNPALAQTCLAAITSAYATGSITSTAHQAIVTACAPVFSKNVPVGGPCTADGDCKSPSRCKLTAAGSGTCEDVTLVGVGGDCSQSTELCDTGLYCLANQNCVTKKAEGHACMSFSIPCADDLLCTPSGTGSGGSTSSGDIPGTCTAKESNNDACTSDSDCTSGYCTNPTGAKSGNVCFTTVVFGVGSPLCSNFGS